VAARDRLPRRSCVFEGSSYVASRAAGARFCLAVLLAGVEEQRLILVVEDDEATRSFLLDNLAADGFRVAGASAASEALRAIEVRQPALVVLDLRLDGGSGLDVLDRVRAADGLSSRIDPDLPVIVLSGRAGDADRVRSFTRGADDHLCKPARSLSPRAGDDPGARYSRRASGRALRWEGPTVLGAAGGVVVTDARRGR
jgi:CheY-like chemotaxis protein